MNTRIGMALILALLAACTATEEVILIEPIMEEPMVSPDPVEPCDTGDDDGIGGTGCAPVE